MQRRTRIVATLGPATDRPGVLEALIDAGLNVVRINFSHGQPADHVRRIRQVRAVAGSRVVGVLADLPGPKLRVRLAQPIALTVGQSLRLAMTDKLDELAAGEVGVTEPDCLRDVRPGHRLLLDDGRLQVEVLGTDSGGVTGRVLVGGLLEPDKGLNLPDTPLSIPNVTPRDHAALAVAAQAGVDWLALSFVRKPEAADDLRAAARDAGLKGVAILAKIERPEAVAQSSAIIAAFDGVMIARGDLGVEMPLESVPLVQKQIIAQARALGRPVVTATDMLDSMRKNPRPTRAEAGDVANAIFDGTDAVMLSGETSIGDYPLEAVACMDRIARETEVFLARAGLGRSPIVYPSEDPLPRTACELAEQVQADAIVTPTLSGRTARLLARYRPWMPIVAPVPNELVARQLALLWGVYPVLLQPRTSGEDRLATAVRSAFQAGVIRAGQRVVVLAGHPMEDGPRLPTIRLVRVGADGSSINPE
jgi:pyruvate kinase